MPLDRTTLTPDLALRLHELEENLLEMVRVVICYSAGVDSTFLVAFAVALLGRDRVLAVIGDSATLPRSELKAAREMAEKIGVTLRVIETREMDDPRFIGNPDNRCFHCKSELFRRALGVAEREGFAFVLDGTNADDLVGHRPGLQASLDSGVKSPLALAGLTKQDIRELSRLMGLSTWDKPSMACLASRFPYGRPITTEGLNRVEQAEAFIRSLGFGNVRVRDHGGLARIEVDASCVREVVRPDVDAKLKELGFRYVTVDIGGFRSGSMNPEKPPEYKEQGG